ncbi:LuxR C-terminal-related transcriptional regulator [Saccharicrinis sp. GN24d3]|uniref:LuxR C-terminal-related transcriptional regulator n=1 Tax=Saccharicrinis sp. GN24d3 TaxID=3458416 RepID=UPI0040358434
MSDGTKGVFKVELNEELDSVLNVKLYGKQHGLPTAYKNILLTINKSWYLSAIDGLYVYNSLTDRFEKDKNINMFFDLDGQMKNIKQDEDGNYWYIEGKGASVSRRNDDGTYTKITSPFMQLQNKLVRNWEFLYVHGNENVFIATENGFAHYSSRIVSSYNQSFKSFITQVDVPYLDTVFYANFEKNTVNLPFRKNELRFKFAAPFYQNPEQVEFSYYIDNYSESWSSWTRDNYRDLSNLHENKYVFRVKARNSFGIESEEASFTFIIDPPWHRSTLAYFFYVLLLISIGLIVLWVIQKRFEISKQMEQKKHQEYLLKKEREHEQKSILAEKEIIRLRNEKLKDEKLYLDKELVNQTLHNVNKNKFLMKINQELKLVSDDTKDGAVKTKMVILRKRINKEIDNHQQKEIFDSHFEAVHSDFFDRLKEQFPQLSPKDIRLCAYIKMNLSTKEIAPMLNISERGVEINRYRLRKKLGLSRDINLSTFLLNL